ncbi:oxaloacetate decarboxylase [Pedobacter sp. SYP-B3415]|uniref:isocitrate lyase/PEP mutase family protein n=1 Tax=Pedobacter sp. SYP-B3415 TaxID=2496641 RepID=UPI00101E0D23|nr:isocitrate lyase/phosphoenolpyruvate mutase family protein [Pedobacter sp. SYP-B3415]
MTTVFNDRQLALAERFKTLHERPGTFIIPNPWDAGSARLLASQGFEALATTSAGLAFSLAKADGEGALTRQEAFVNARSIVNAVNVPVAADLENGYGQNPDTCAETILLAAACGLVGGSIEDTTGNRDRPIHDFKTSVARIRTAVRAARSLPFPFMLAARAENLIYGVPDLTDTMNRLEAYADAGADVLFAPGLRTREEVALAVRTVAPKPLNVVVGLGGSVFSVRELEDLGVKRISLGSTLARVAMGALLEAGREMQQGTFNFAAQAPAYAELNEVLR